MNNIITINVIVFYAKNVFIKRIFESRYESVLIIIKRWLRTRFGTRCLFLMINSFFWMVTRILIRSYFKILFYEEYEGPLKWLLLWFFLTLFLFFFKEVISLIFASRFLKMLLFIFFTMSFMNSIWSNYCV